MFFMGFFFTPDRFMVKCRRLMFRIDDSTLKQGAMQELTQADQLPVHVATSALLHKHSLLVSIKKIVNAC